MNIKLKKTQKVFLLASLIFISAAIVSCKKDSKDSPKPVTGSGKVALLNGAFGSSSFNLFIDAKKANKTLIDYCDSLNYVEALAGDRSFEIKGNDDKSILKKSIKIDKDKNYSILASNSKDGKTYEFVQITDDLTAPKTDKAKIRFVHLSPDAPKLNLVSGENKIAENLTYKNASAFKEVDAQKVSFDVVDPEGKKTILTIKDLQLNKGKIYTIWITGLKETEDVKKKLQTYIFINK